VVPSVDGQAISSAGQALIRAGFQVRELSRSHPTVRAGIVLSQDPAAGSRLERGRLVTLVVSSGRASVVLNPSQYIGKALDPVLVALIRMGLRVSVTMGPPVGRLGTVTAINPSGALYQGDGVTVTIATRSEGQARWLAAGTAGASGTASARSEMTSAATRTASKGKAHKHAKKAGHGGKGGGDGHG
jgi:serine/threonine-protein kinase